MTEDVSRNPDSSSLDESRPREMPDRSSKRMTRRRRDGEATAYVGVDEDGLATTDDCDFSDVDPDYDDVLSNIKITELYGSAATRKRMQNRKPRKRTEGGEIDGAPSAKRFRGRPREEDDDLDRALVHINIATPAIAAPTSVTFVRHGARDYVREWHDESETVENLAAAFSIELATAATALAEHGGDVEAAVVSLSKNARTTEVREDDDVLRQVLELSVQTAREDEENKWERLPSSSMDHMPISAPSHSTNDGRAADSAIPTCIVCCNDMVPGGPNNRCCLIPCGHYDVCIKCAHKLPKPKKCPMCRKPIAQVIRLCGS